MAEMGLKLQSQFSLGSTLLPRRKDWRWKDHSGSCGSNPSLRELQPELRSELWKWKEGQILKRNVAKNINTKEESKLLVRL